MISPAERCTVDSHQRTCISHLDQSTLYAGKQIFKIIQKTNVYSVLLVFLVK
jgi:hypothetical protein